MLEMPRVREVFEASTDFTVGLEEEFAILDPRTLSLDQRFEELRAAGAGRPGPGRVGGRRADQVRDRDPLGPRRELRRRGGEAARGALAPVRAGRAPRRAARRHRDAPVEPLAGAGDHRHRALPARAGRAPVRGLAQQHLQPARARGRERRRARGPRLRPAARGDARAARDLGQLAVPRRAPLRPPLGAHADLHEELSALRDPGRVRLLAGLRGLRRLPRPDQLDHRVHAGLVERAPAPLVRDGRDAHLRRADAARTTPPRSPR